MTLGRLIFAEGHIVVPYRNIATLAAGLVAPLMVGILGLSTCQREVVGCYLHFRFFNRLVC